MEDPALTSALLDYLWLVLPSVEDRDSVLCDVVVHLRHASGDDNALSKEEPGYQFAFDEKSTKSAGMFCMARIRSSIDEVDVAISDARKSGKGRTSEHSVSVMMERSDTRTAQHADR